MLYDPFLLFDHHESVNPPDYEAGFPYDAHRGIETVTIVRKAEIQHKDSLGHRGTIGAGDIQRERSSRFWFSMIWIPFMVIQIAWHSNGRSASSPGTASTAQQSPPTHAIFLPTSQFATVFPAPGSPLLYSTLSFFQRLMWPVRNRNR